jgi:hypothetical protein
VEGEEGQAWRGGRWPSDDGVGQRGAGTCGRARNDSAMMSRCWQASEASRAGSKTPIRRGVAVAGPPDGMRRAARHAQRATKVTLLTQQ